MRAGHRKASFWLLNQCLKAFRTNYFLRVIPNKWYHRIIWHASSWGVASIWSWKMLKESQGNPTRSRRNPNKNYNMLEQINPILRDVWFFLEILPPALDTINSKSTEETRNAEGNLEFREHVKATKTWKPKKIYKNWKKFEKKTHEKIFTKANKTKKMLEKTKKKQKNRTNWQKTTYGPPKGHSLQKLFLNMLECYCLAFLSFFSFL